MEPYVGDIRMFAATFSPVNYAFCNGQSLDIYNYQALFTLVGTLYGGDGVNTFNVPDLQGRLPVHVGQASNGGVANWTLGMSNGTENVTLTSTQIPPHNHSFMVSNADVSITTASGNAIAKGKHYSTTIQRQAPLSNMVLQAVGGGQAHNNRMPYLGINFIIALNGVFPTRN